jgi:hypothetical protein
MADINIAELTKAVTDKYSIVSNAFKLASIKNASIDAYKNEPKDEINIIVGDDKQPDKVYPQVKLCRWSNEVNFSIRLVDNEIGEETVKTEANKIVWEKGNIKIENCEFLEGEGGYKFIWYLKSKPISNKVEFTIQSKGLDFFYQPELTPEEIARGAYRPEDVVGSYAVYHSTKRGMNDINGKDYKTGNAFHIYRPHLFDSNGLEAWGVLNIENGIYSVEIPQDFLDKAVYPIKSNDTFGNTTQQSTSYSLSGTAAAGSFVAPEDGTISSISTCVILAVGANPGNVNVGFNSGTTGAVQTHIAHGTSTPISPSSKSFQTVNVSGSITNGARYWLQFKQEYVAAGYDIYYDSSSGNYMAVDGTEGYTTWGNSPSFTYGSNFIASIYATYTPSATSAIPFPMQTDLMSGGMQNLSGGFQ